MFYTLFDSAHLGNPTKYAGRIFGREIPDAWPTHHYQGHDTFSGLTDADNPRDYAPRFHPTAADDAEQANTSPLNHTREELDAEATAAFFGSYPADPQTWDEHDALNANGQFGYRREEV